MIIRPYGSLDREAVIDLWARSGLLRPWNDPGEDIARKLRVQPDLFLVGIREGQLLATAMGGYDGHRGWVNYLAVDPAYRRSGYGRAIMAELERRLRALGCPKLNLQIRADNLDAVRFYERLGFTQDAVVSLGRRLGPDPAAGAGPLITEFLSPGPLGEGNLELVLEQKVPADPARDLVPVYHFGIVVAGERVGTIRLRLGLGRFLLQEAGQVGYSVEAAHRGHRYACRALRALLPLARRHGYAELWITCNPENLASRRTCELAGAELVEIVDVPPDSPMFARGERQKCRYRLRL